MNVIAFGSCLSRLTAMRLSTGYGFDHLNNVYHVTSEQFVKYYVDRSEPQPSLEFLEGLFVPADTADAVIYAQGLLRNQYSEYMGLWELFDPEKRRPFFETIETTKVDLFILDNFVDLGTKSLFFKDMPIYKNSPVQFVTHMYKNELELMQRFEFGDYISPASSAEYWKKIIVWLKKKQPAARIVFLCFFGCTSLDNPARQQRAADFFTYMAPIARELDIAIVPPLDVPRHLQIEGDWMHVDDLIYDGLAGHAYLYTTTGFRLE